MSKSMPESGQDAQGKDHLLARKTAGRTRFVATVPAIGLLVAAVVLAIGTLMALLTTSYNYIVGSIDLHGLAISYVEYADAFLLAVALYILSIGLVSLFITDSIPLPKWLAFNDFDDLKERLTSVIVVMIGVFFLGHVLKGGADINTLWLGLACAAVVIALTLFVKAIFKSGE